MNLPELFSATALREGGDAFARAVALGQAGAGAGTLIWVRRSDSCDCAVVLEPEENGAAARKVIFAGMLAVAEALGELSLAETARPIGLELRWPDAVWVDGALVGGGRIETAPCSEIGTPDWLVFGFTLRLEDDKAGAAGLRRGGGAGFETVAIIERFAVHFMHVLDDWASNGPDHVVERWERYRQGAIGEDLAAALLVPSWMVDGEIAG